MIRFTRSAIARLAALVAPAAVWSCAGAPSSTDVAAAPAPAPVAAQAPRFAVPIDYATLPNGLKVVLSRDTTAPLATVAVYYNIGFRIEPRDRTGFAHLFEHMMFQGSRNLGKMEFIKLVQANGGVLNGSTRFDFTNYFEIVPAHTLETMLWAEADRMRGLQITQENLTNQQGVVKNEVRVNVLNQPYGGFPWLDMPQHANENWYNSHNFYGELEDLDAATLQDVQAFFEQYYAPNNAVLVVVGDFDPARTKAWIQQYFGPIPRVNLAPKPDISEPVQTREKRASREDRLATRPALAFAYHVPPRNSPEYWAMGIIDQILLQGRDSRLWQELVQRRGVTGAVGGGINMGLGNMFNYDGPMLWTGYMIHDPGVPADSIMGAVSSVIEELRTTPVDAETLARARIKTLSNFYNTVEGTGGLGRADLLAVYALFDDDPAMINRIEESFAKVTPELILKTAQEYLRPTNRTVLTVEPRKATP